MESSQTYISEKVRDSNNSLIKNASGVVSYLLDSGGAGGGGIQLEGATQVANNSLKLKYMARAGQVARAYATNGAGNNNAEGRIQVFYYD